MPEDDECDQLPSHRLWHALRLRMGLDFGFMGSFATEGLLLWFLEFFRGVGKSFPQSPSELKMVIASIWMAEPFGGSISI